MGKEGQCKCTTVVYLLWLTDVVPLGPAGINLIKKAVLRIRFLNISSFKKHYSLVLINRSHLLKRERLSP